MEDVSIVASDVSLYYQDGTRFGVELLDSNNDPLSDENLTISVNGQNYSRVTNYDGKASIAINLIPGDYVATVYYLGDYQYSKYNKTANIKVLPTISGDDVVMYYKDGTQYHATFLDIDGEFLDFRNVTFNINGVFYVRETNQNGVAKLNINLNSGDYILTAYNPANGFSYSNNIKILPTINGSDLKKVCRDNNQYWVTIIDNKGNLLADTNVEFNIHGVFYTRKTNEKGCAKLNINLDAGKYTITAQNLVTGEYCSNEITVVAFSKTKLSTKNYSFKATDDDTIQVKLTNELGYGVNGETVKVVVNKKTYTAITDDNGVARFYLNLTQGNYSLKFSHEANSRYGASSASSTVKTIGGTKVKLVGKNEIIFVNGTYSVKLYDENNKAFSKQKVYFDFNSNIFSAVTNSNGVASITVNLPQDCYNVIYFFNGSGYKFSRGFSTVYVLKDGSTKLTQLNTNVKEANGEKLKVMLTAGTIRLPNEEIIIEINGKNYTKITDSDGVASLTINLNAGKYDVKYYFKGDGKFLKSQNSSVLTVTQRISTKLTVLTGSTYHKNSGITYNIELKANNVLSGKKIVVTIGSKEYTQNTDSNGVIHLNIDSLKTGTYDVSFSFDGDKEYAPCSGSAKLTVTSEIPYGYGYWVRYSDMYNLDLASLASQGTNHIFLHSYAFTAYGKSSVVSWIQTANNYGIKVHIWVQAFYNGGWINPVNSDGSYKYSLFDDIIKEAKYYAGLKGVSGVHLDYLRYPGTAHKYSTGTGAINYLVSHVSSAVKSVNPNCILSAAVMPEPSSMIYYYGQDIPTISKYLDVIIPMVYKGNYERGTSWIQTTTKWFVDNSNGAQIWTGLQAYESDDDITKLSVSELSGDAQVALDGGARGVVMFRWGVTNFINFDNLKMS